MLDLDYNEKSRELVIREKSNTKEIIEIFESSSRPINYSNKWVLISPFEWECQGKVHLIDIKQNVEILKLPIHMENDESIKAVTWANEHTLLLIIGSLWGTVNVGGDLYSYNIQKDEKELLRSFTPHIQVSQIFFEEGNIVLNGIKYVDDDFNKFIAFNDLIKIDVGS